MKTIEEKITQDLFDALAGIRVTAGYQFDAVVEYSGRQGNQNGNARLILRDGALEPAPTQYLGRDTYHKTYYVVCPVMASDVSADGEDELAARLRGDVIEAVMDDYTRGGYAINTHMLRADPEAIPDSGGSVLAFRVHFWTLLDDPFRQS